MTIATTPAQTGERAPVEHVFVDQLRPLLPVAHRLAWRAFDGLRPDVSVPTPALQRLYAWAPAGTTVIVDEPLPGGPAQRTAP